MRDLKEQLRTTIAEYADLDEWKLKFMACNSDQVRIGMLHALNSGTNFFEVRQLYLADKHKECLALSSQLNKEGLFYAAESLQPESEVTGKALWMLITRFYDPPIEMVYDENMAKMISLVQRSLDCPDAEYMQKEDFSKRLVRIITFLMSGGPKEWAHDYPVLRVAMGLCHFSPMIVDVRWLGHPHVIAAFQKRPEIAGFQGKVSDLVLERWQIAKRHYVIHLAASGYFNSILPPAIER